MIDDDESAEEKETKNAREINKIIQKAERVFDFGAEISNEHEKNFGICSHCKNFMFAEAEFTVIFAKCQQFDNALTQKNAIRNCSLYDEKGSLSLYDMRSMATLIDDVKPKREVGFISQTETDEKKENENTI